MFKHLLIPLDGSQFSEQAIKPAVALADKFKSKITVVSVVQLPQFVLDPEGAGGIDLMMDIQKRLHEETERYLLDIQKRLSSLGYDVDLLLLESNYIADIILDSVLELEADAIVMSTHGRTGLSRWVYGSVADRVLRHATVPVVLIRAVEESKTVAVPIDQTDEQVVRELEDPQSLRPFDQLIDERLAEAEYLHLY